MKKTIFAVLVAVVAIVFFLVVSGGIYTVRETKQVIVTQFGRAVGDPVTEPGLKFKIPIIQKANVLDKRILEWDGQSTEMPTKDKTYIRVDTYGRWRIVDPLVYLKRVRDEDRAQSRLDAILGSNTRNTIAGHELIEVIRTTKEREPQVGDDIQEADLTGSVGKLIPIERGRSKLEEDILEESKQELSEYGIELLDLRFKRINYNQSVQEQIYDRMISERQQIAEKFRSEGEGEAAKILGDMERELRTIESEAYEKVQTIRGEADAEATDIYAQAFNQSTEAAEFYEFLRTMELYESMLTGESTVVLSTDSDLFKYLKAVKPVGPSSSADPLVPPEAAKGVDDEAEGEPGGGAEADGGPAETDGNGVKADSGEAEEQGPAAKPDEGEGKAAADDAKGDAEEGKGEDGEAANDGSSADGGNGSSGGGDGDAAPGGGAKADDDAAESGSDVGEPAPPESGDGADEGEQGTSGDVEDGGGAGPGSGAAGDAD